MKLNTMHLVITHSNEDMNGSQGIYVSTDHLPVEFQLNLEVKQWMRKRITGRNMRRIIKRDFYEDLKQTFSCIPNTDLESSATFNENSLTYLTCSLFEDCILI